MQHFPIFLDLKNQHVVLSGGGEAALAKLRLILKTQACITVYAPCPDPQIAHWAADGRLTLHRRGLQIGDVRGARLFYAADENDAQDTRTATIARAEGALVNIVDNLHDSAFITPAIVDRDPVVVAIGTEGAAPVLARQIKADLERRLPATLGPLARIGKGFRKLVEALPHGRARRDFWADYYNHTGPQAIASGETAVPAALRRLLTRHLNQRAQPGRVDLVGIGPGDADLLTLRARNALDAADIVICDIGTPPQILELARREAIMMGADTTAETALTHARDGAHIVRLIHGSPDATDAWCLALRQSGTDWSIIPGLLAPTTSPQNVREFA